MIKGRHSICGVSPTEKVWWMVICILRITFSISNRQAVGVDCGRGLILACPWWMCIEWQEISHSVYI